MSEREFMGRCPDARTGIYREVSPDDERWFVGKSATRPVVVIDTATQVADVTNLGWFTTSTTATIARALRQWGLWIGQNRWGYDVAGTHVEPHSCTYGCGLTPNECPHWYTEFRIDLANRKVIA